MDTGWRDLSVKEIRAMFGESVSQDRADYLNECARESIAAERRKAGRQLEYNLGKVQRDFRGGGFMETFVKFVVGSVIAVFYLVVIALSCAVPVAIVWAAYHFITTYKG
jgi:hypothetical protein